MPKLPHSALNRLVVSGYDRRLYMDGNSSQSPRAGRRKSSDTLDAYQAGLARAGCSRMDPAVLKQRRSANRLAARARDSRGQPFNVS
jgi:hypothetical protein